MLFRSLFDIDVYQKGIVKPYDFIQKFSHLGIPDVVYEGYYNQQLIDDVKNNIYNLSEGVVVKGLIKVKRNDVENDWMVKIKTLNWLEKVKSALGEKKLLEELNGDKSLFNEI